MRTRTSIGRMLCLGFFVSATLLSGKTAYAQTPAALARPISQLPTSAFDDDEPPLTAYDRLIAQAPLGVQPETQGLLHLAGRLFAALVAVVALIYASLKFLLPRYFKKWSQGAGRELQLIERLSLDGRNAVVMVQMGSGDRVLLGTGEHGVQFLTRVEQPEMPSFHETLTSSAVVNTQSGDPRHAAEH